MKRLITFLIITSLTLTLCNAQSSLQVNIKDCRGEGSFEYLEEFKLYKDGSLIKTVEPKHDRTQYLKNLSFGKYRIEYKSIFEKIENIEIEINEKKKYVIDLCLNYINYKLESYKPFIDQLENGESYSIQISSQGCFHYSKENYLIKRIENDFYLTFDKKETCLNESNIKAIRHFEIELNYMQSFGCSTTDHYTVQYKNKKVVISDGSCAWKGDYYLKKDLNLITEK
jgi:hypothetical protein